MGFIEGELLKKKEKKKQKTKQNKKKKIGGRTRYNLTSLGGAWRGAKGELIKLSSTCIIFIKRVDSTAFGNQLQTLKHISFRE